MINHERTIQGNGAPPCGLGDRSDSEIVRITAHFWVGDWLYEVDYDKVGRADDRTRLIRVHGSERRCECPGRDDAERTRRDRGVRHAAAPMSPVGR